MGALKTFSTRLVVIVAALGLSALAAAADDDVKIVEAESDGIKGLIATFEINRDRDTVFETLNDTRGFKKIFPKVHEVRVLREEGNTRDIYFRVDAVLSEASYTLRRVHKRGKGSDVIVWNRISGDANVIKGSWTLSDGDKPGVTKVVYSSYVDVSAFVPVAVVRSLAIGNVHEMVGLVRAACDRRAASKLSPPTP